MRKILSIVLVVILSANVTYAAKATSAGIPSQATKKPTLQEKVLEIPPGSRVQVRLKNKEKLRGRLGEVSNEGFVVQYARGNQIEERKTGFDEVKSLKVKGDGSKKAVLILAAVGAGVGLFFLILFVALLQGT